MRRPPIVVATPGRLWQLMNEPTPAGAYLSDLLALQFLVLDEADRMTERGHYAELSQLLARLPRVQLAAPGVDEAANAAAAKDARERHERRLERQRKGEEAVRRCACDSSSRESQRRVCAQTTADAEIGVLLAQRPRQTFIFSATLGSNVSEGASALVCFLLH